MATSKEGSGKEFWKGIGWAAVAIGALLVGAELLDGS